jgi:hypothetical protein
MLQQNQKIEEQQKDYNGVVSKRHFEVDRELKDVCKQRLDSESELRAMENEFSREGHENYENKMTIIKEKEFDKLDNTRHTLEVKLQEDLIKAKEIEKKEFEDGRN